MTLLAPLPAAFVLALTTQASVAVGDDLHDHDVNAMVDVSIDVIIDVPTAASTTSANPPSPSTPSASSSMQIAAQTSSSNDAARPRWTEDDILITLSHRDVAAMPQLLSAVLSAAEAWNETQLAPRIDVEIAAGALPADNFTADGINALVLASEWPTNPNALGVTYRRMDVERVIHEGDILLNLSHPLGFMDVEVDEDDLLAPIFDVENLVAHELGHLLGLGEELGDKQATMYFMIRKGEAHKRTLAAADVAALRVTYPNGRGGAVLDVDEDGGGCLGPAPDVAAASLFLGLVLVRRNLRMRPRQAVRT